MESAWVCTDMHNICAESIRRPYWPWLGFAGFYGVCCPRLPRCFVSPCPPLETRPTIPTWGTSSEVRDLGYGILKSRTACWISDIFASVASLLWAGTISTMSWCTSRKSLELGSGAYTHPTASSTHQVGKCSPPSFCIYVCVYISYIIYHIYLYII